MAEAKLYGQNKGGTSINGIIKDYYAYAEENISAGDLVEYVNGVAGQTNYGTSADTQVSTIGHAAYCPISAVALDENRVFIAHGSASSSNASNYLYGVVCTINGATITVGTDTQLSSTSYSGATISACLLQNGNVFVAHRYGSNYYLRGMVCTIEGTTITAGTDTSIVGSSYAGWAISTYLLPNGNVFIAHSYSSSYRLYGIVVSISGDAITAGTDTVLVSSSKTGYVISTCLLPNGDVFIAHSYGSDYYLYGMVVSINGTTITKGTDTQLSTTEGTARSLSTCLLNNGNIFIAHNYTTSYYLYGTIISINGTTITINSSTQLSTNPTWSDISTQLLSNGNVLIVHSGTNTRQLYSMVVNVNDNAVITGTDVQLNNIDYSGYEISTLLLPNGTIFIAHSYTSDYYLYAQIFGIDVTNNILSNNIVATEYETQIRKTTTAQFDGIAKTSGTGGDDTGHKDVVSIWTNMLYVDGAIAIWTAEDGLNENNQWVDRVSGYVFTPRNASIVPLCNSEEKLLDFNQFGGMESNFKPENIDYTIEIVTRDIANSKGESTTDGLMLTSANSTNGLHGFTFCQKNSSTVGIIQVNNDASQRINHKLSDFEDNSLDTFAATTTEQALNGIIVKNYTTTPEHTSVLALGCRKGTSSHRAKFKVHCIRYYPFKLTTEQLAHNREVDIAIFGD